MLAQSTLSAVPIGSSGHPHLCVLYKYSNRCFLRPRSFIKPRVEEWSLRFCCKCLVSCCIRAVSWATWVRLAAKLSNTRNFCSTAPSKRTSRSPRVTSNETWKVDKDVSRPLQKGGLAADFAQQRSQIETYLYFRGAYVPLMSLELRNRR